MDKLLSGALVFHKLDGWARNEPSFFLDSWKQADSKFVNYVNSLSPLKWLQLSLGHFQKVSPWNGTSFAYDAVIALGVGACANFKSDIVEEEEVLPGADDEIPGLTLTQKATLRPSGSPLLIDNNESPSFIGSEETEIPMKSIPLATNAPSYKTVAPTIFIPQPTPGIASLTLAPKNVDVSPKPTFPPVQDRFEPFTSQPATVPVEPATPIMTEPRTIIPTSMKPINVPVESPTGQPEGLRSFFSN
jgi:hypothetical protein